MGESPGLAEDERCIPQEEDLPWKEVYHRLLGLMRVNNHTSLFYIVWEYFVLFLVCDVSGAVYSAWTHGQLALPVFLPLAAVSMVLIAAIQHRFSGLAHDASHYVLFRNKLANELVSDV